ncbi:hypothetical protein [Allokutzneria sp. NRRL B-24872]|uniref:hypothetical protein n=1 Tax=Allokutzneria sp. NRRL B-24872 TaxID=1137961 RepID=UPI00143CD0EA|nr:hypothetical protein [Allokutzneria sp. NRRL B-24872]
MGALGFTMVAGAAFFALSAAPANATVVGAGQEAQSAGALGETCTISDHVRRDHLKRCISGGGQASVSHRFLNETSCGVGGQKSRYTFARTMHSSCASGEMLPYTTPCQ